MSTRLCARCHRQKSIRGVWYLTPVPGGVSPFVCEGCFVGPEAQAAPLA